MASAVSMTFREALMARLATQTEVVKALPSAFKAKDATTWKNKDGFAKALVDGMLNDSELRAAFSAVAPQLIERLQDSIPEALAAAQGSSSSSVVIDLTAFAATLEDLYIGERRLGKFWARWLVFHFAMGITPGFKWTDLEGSMTVDLEGADVNTSYSLPALGKEFYMIHMLYEALNTWVRETFEDPEALDVHIHAEGTALTATDPDGRPVEFYNRTLVLVLTTGAATEARRGVEAAEKLRRKKWFAAEARRRARNTADCKEDLVDKPCKQPGAYTLARAAGIVSAKGGARAGAGGGR